MLHIHEPSSTGMPGFLDEAWDLSYCTSTDGSSHENAFDNLSAEERLAAKKSFSMFCKPVELYNFLHDRATEHPFFLQRSLDYKIRAKHQKRIHMTVSLSCKDDEPPCVFPLSICLARLDPNDEDEETKKYSAVYKTNQIFTFRGSSEVDGYGNTQVQASFMLPELDKLDVEAKFDKLSILVFASAGNPISTSGVNTNVVPLDVASEESRAGETYLLGKICLESVSWLWACDPKFNLGQRTELLTVIELRPCILKYGIRKKGKSILIQDPSNSDRGIIAKQLLTSISAEEFGAKDKSPNHIHASNELASTSLSHIIRLKERNVTFKYRFYNNKLQVTEVTEDFYCPFCLAGCASYEGLRCHLLSCHDLFDFEFSTSEDGPYVNVSFKIDIWNPQIIADGVYPRDQTFTFCAKPLKRKEAKSASFKNGEDTDQMLLDPEIPAGDTELLDKDDGSNAIILHPALDCVPPISEHDHSTPAAVDMEWVSNASILPQDPDCAPPISEHDHGAPMVLQVDKGKLPISEHDHGAAVVLQVDKGKLPISEHDHGAAVVLQVDKGKLPISEHDHGAPVVLRVDKGKLPISEHDHGAPVVLRVDKGKLPTSEHDHGAPVVRRVDKGKLPISEHDHRAPVVRRVDKGKLPISEHDHRAPVVRRVDKRKLPISKHDHGAPVVRRVDKGKLPISEHDHGAPVVRRVDKGKLPISEHDHGAPVVRRVGKRKLPISEHDHGAPVVRRVDKGKLPRSKHDHRAPVVQRVDKRKLPISKHDRGKRKLPIKDDNSKTVDHLKERQFYHSHKYQPMVMEEVQVDQDSEDETDEEIIQIEERRMLKDLDVSDTQKQFMFMWNSFVRRHGVRADGHIHWACEAFTRFYLAVLAESPALAWRWRLFMIKLWNHGLLDAQTIDRCNVILQQYQNQN